MSRRPGIFAAGAAAPRRRRLRAVLRGRPPLCADRPAAVQARPDGAAHPLVRRRARRRRTWPATPRVLQADKDELDGFLDRVTINVSQLWRNPEQWEVLEEQILPELAASGRNRVRAWSAGLLLRRRGLHAGRRRPPRDPARAGRDPGHRHRRPHGRARPHRRASPPRTPATRPPRDAGLALRDGRRRLARQRPSSSAWCASRPATCCACSPAAASYDLVLCRNTVIYFNEDVRDALHGRLAASLRPGGYLVVGATERVADPAGHRPRARLPLHLPEERDGHLRVPPHVPRRVPRAPPGAQPRRRPHRGGARRPRDRRRDLPHRALAEGHERDDGLRRHGGAHARDGGRLRAAAPARRRA